MKKKSKHPHWAIEHRKPGTELKLNTPAIDWNVAMSFFENFLIIEKKC